MKNAIIGALVGVTTFLAGVAFINWGLDFKSMSLESRGIIFSLFLCFLLVGALVGQTTAPWNKSKPKNKEG